MGYQVLARKYRPQRFADVAGQDHVTRTLMNALSQNRIAHGYIFSGHRGIGKTTIARIVAMALNCRTAVGSPERPTPEPCGVCDSCTEVRLGSAVDVIEIDAATNRGIDEIRELRDAARYSPARDRYKIYILDEAHQITEAAFNALLKTLEEPPSHVIFMMATTEPENIPQTIRSRCQHFSFHAVKFDDILAQLKSIAAQEEVEAEESALALLAEAGDGSMRDALSIMDQAIASAPTENGRPVLSTVQIRELMGSVPNAVFERLMEAVAAQQSAGLMEELNVLLNAGNSPSSLARQMVRYLRNALMSRLGGEQTELLQISADERARAARTALLFTEEDLTRNLQIILRTFDDLNYRQEQRFHLELGMLKLIHAQRLLPLEELLSGVVGSSGVRNPAAASAARPASTTPRATPTPPSATTASASAASTISPFGSTSSASSRPEPRQSAAVAEPSRIVPAPVAQPSVAAPRPVTPFPVAASQSAGFAEAVTEGALAKAPQAKESTAPPSEPLAETFAKREQPTASPRPAAPQADALRQAVVDALASSGHASASQLLGTGHWALEGSSLRIEVPGMGKKMISLTINAAAEKIIRQELQRLGAPTRFLVVPGEGAPGATPVSAPPPEGSVQQQALDNPLVQRAKEIFKAEVRSVVDLRVK
ncbi:MAG TPA: DNA polymerase III subunit gamma/tau [Terracidiphilus sp.]|nr:DNA polymerase III subunit gamma/tau [Terracidiphilus sp.]